MDNPNRLQHPLDSDFGMDNIFDENQLSSDLERIVNIQVDKIVHDLETTDHVAPKVEERGSCRFAGQGGAFPSSESGFQANQPGMFTTPTYPPQDIKPELSSMPWSLPQNPGNWRATDCPPSLSEADLETDDVSYIPQSPFNPQNITINNPPLITSIPVPQKVPSYDRQYDQRQMHQQALQQLLGGGKPQHYPMDEKLMKYEDEENISVGSVQKHQAWQNQSENILQQQFHQQQHNLFQQQEQQYQQQQQQQPELSPSAKSDDATMATEEAVYYTFEADENGEGPLHILSAVSDKTSLAKNLDVILQCGVIQECINLQNKYKQTPLFLAVQASNVIYVAWLLENGADPNIQGTLYTDRDEYVWRAPIHLAAMMGDAGLPMIRLILRKSPLTNIDLMSHGDKLTALHMALKLHNPLQQFSCRLVILELIDKRVDTTIRDQSSSKTPCMLVVETRDLQLIQEFLDKFPAERRRTMLQEQTRGGDTCLHLAAGLSRMESAQKIILLRLLVTNGANGNIPNNVREFPKDFARYEWNQLRRT